MIKEWFNIGLDMIVERLIKNPLDRQNENKSYVQMRIENLSENKTQISGKEFNSGRFPRINQIKSI